MGSQIGKGGSGKRMSHRDSERGGKGGQVRTSRDSGREV